jgi:tripartite-type tricarboxylate transporter receptor subunit TctC
MENLGLEVSTMTSAEFGRFISSEIVQWGRVVKATGVRGE